MVDQHSSVPRWLRAATLATLALGPGCSPEPDLEEIWAGRWDVREHTQAPECEAYGPAEPEWSAFEIAFVELDGFLAMTVARCEGGCDGPSAAVTLEVANETQLEGTDTEAGLFNSTDGEVCQASLIEAVATFDGEGLVLDLRSFFGALPPPNDGDCDRLVSDVSGDLCDEALHFEAVR